jgi:5-amino-6-(5-phosphoribosylamino)uracil reductase
VSGSPVDWRARFEAFAARKTAEAETASIAPLATEADCGDQSLVSLANDWTRRMFDGPFYASPAPAADLPSTNLVFVQSREGNTVAKDPSTLGGGEADKHLIYEGLSRVAADAVLGGAGTIRGDIVLSVWRRELVDLRAALGLPRHPAQIVATLQGLPLDTGLIFNVPDLRVVVITVARGAAAMRDAAAARPWMSLLVMESAADLRPAFRTLRELGVERLSCIGGRTLAGQLIDAGLVQDVYLTTSPRSGGEPNTPFYAKPLSAREVVRKRGTGVDEGVAFQHLRIE